MDYFLVDTSPFVDPGFVFLRNPPEGTDDLTYRMAEGDPMGEDYPEDAKLYMDNKHKGIKLPSLIGNTDSFLILHQPLVEVLQTVETGPIEYLPFTLYDHKKRVASTEYRIVNPLGTFDCLDLEASEIEWYEGDIVEIEEFVFAAEKMKDAPDLFRIQEAPQEYVVSHRLVSEWQKLEPTNIYLTRIEQV